MDIRLIAMDLDGTALQPDRRSFSPRLIAALEEAHQRGIAIAPVTGGAAKDSFLDLFPQRLHNEQYKENI